MSRNADETFGGTSITSVIGLTSRALHKINYLSSQSIAQAWAQAKKEAGNSNILGEILKYCLSKKYFIETHFYIFT